MTTLNERDYTDPDEEATKAAREEVDAPEKDGEEDEEEPPGLDAQTDEEIDARARSMGWVPEAEWDDRRAEIEGRRKPRTFVTARQWLEKMEVSGPLLRSAVRRLEQELRESRKQGDEMYAILQDQRKSHVEALERARADERAKLEQERRQAIAEGDVEAFDKADAALKEHEQKRPNPQQEDPEIVAFKDANKTWFTVDPRLTNNMIDEFGEVKSEMPGASMREQLAEAKRRIMNRFPEKFGINPRREAARRGPTPPTGGADQGSVDRKFAALTPDEKEMWNRTRKLVEGRGGTITKAEWLKEIGR